MWNIKVSPIYVKKILITWHPRKCYWVSGSLNQWRLTIEMPFILNNLPKISRKKYTMKKREKVDAKLFKKQLWMDLKLQRTACWRSACPSRPGWPGSPGPPPPPPPPQPSLHSGPDTERSRDIKRAKADNLFDVRSDSEPWSLGKRSVIEYGQLLCSLLMPGENFRSIDQKPRQLLSLLDNSFTVIINISLPCNF